MASELSADTVGFVGLGKMGAVMAGHILQSGRRVIGFDVREEARAEFAAAGGVAADSLAEVARAPVVVDIVFDDAGTREVTLGAGGLADNMDPGAIHIVMASISPGLAKELAARHEERGQHLLGASVFGRPEAAAAKQLIINCAGPRSVYDTAATMLEAMGKPQWIGEQPEQAMLLKLMGNNMIFTAIELIEETFSFLGAGGIEQATIKAGLIDKLFPGFIYDGYSRRYMEDPAAPKLGRVAKKDNKLCLSAAAELGVELPLVRFLNEHVIP